MTRVLLILALAVIAAHIIQGDPAIRHDTKGERRG